LKTARYIYIYLGEEDVVDYYAQPLLLIDETLYAWYRTDFGDERDELEEVSYGDTKYGERYFCTVISYNKKKNNG